MRNTQSKIDRDWHRKFWNKSRLQMRLRINVTKGEQYKQMQGPFPLRDWQKTQIPMQDPAEIAQV